jgi:hypothetical protein
MRTQTLFLSIAALGLWLSSTVRADDPGYAWLSDGNVRQAGAVEKVVGLGLTESLLAEVGAVPAGPAAPAVPPPAAAPAKTEAKAPTAGPPKRLPPVPPAAPAESPFREETPKAAPPAPSPSDGAAPPAAASEPMDVVVATDFDPCTPCPEPCQDDWFRLLKFPVLEEERIDVRGWIAQGFTWNPDRPANRFNGPVTFNDRSNEYQLNQMYLIVERTTKNDGCGWDLGGRVDVNFGTDSRFLWANGLETRWDQTERFYTLALPQMYADVALNKWLFRFGRFYTIAGYEVCTQPDNFFYSHAYTVQYGEPFTHTGMLAKYRLNDQWTFAAGFHRGWDQWEDNNDKIGFLGGVTWTSPDERTSLALNVVSSNEQPLGESTRTLIDVIFTRKIGEKIRYVLQADFAHETNVVPAQQGLEDAEWFGVLNYLFYDLNPRWTLGLRYEWFSDDDGTRVGGLGYPHGVPLFPVPSHWQEIAVGVNYKPHPNILVRSELRWDWVDPLVAVRDRPFDDFTNGGQFLWGNDLIVKF